MHHTLRFTPSRPTLPPGAMLNASQATHDLTIEHIAAPLKDRMAHLDACIRRELDSDIVLINTLAEYVISAGGKRLRPMLLLLSAQALGYQGEEDLTLAAVIEFIHTATLLHDDVVDESALRRGRNTANDVWGNAAAVLVGDFLYSRAFQMMIRGERMAVLNCLADTTNTIAEGEVLQLLNCNDPETTEARYLDTIDRKTARLFEAAAVLGCIIAERPYYRQALSRYGLQLGRAFQLIDDVLDYVGDPELIGKNLGDDLAEGKPTLPLIYALAHAADDEQELIRDAIRNGDASQAERIAAIALSCGAIDATRQRAADCINEAKIAIAALPPSAARESLSQLATFCNQRLY
ncbi:polyprenyl synthetase family protein [Gammaproteobacteria bacterium]|nr:polyprenyl synthetase family protein [Gammaproteobacteria bacterium]